MINPSGCVEIPLGLFGGEQLDIQATDLPAGLSPGCVDVAFLPGSLFTRPPLQRFASQGTTAQAVYNCSYIKPDASVSQLVFYSDGTIFQDGAQIASTAAGNRFFTANAFGRTHIATSDGLHGADVPLQLSADGTVSRVSQDGPGGPLTIANYAIPPATLTTGSSGTAVAISTIQPIDPTQVQVGGGSGYDGYQPPQYETYYTSLLVTTAAPHGLVVGESIAIMGNTSFNAYTYVSSVDSTTTFEVGIYTQFVSVGTGGTVTSAAPFLQRASNIVSAATTSPHQLQPGYQVTIAGVADEVVGGSVSQIVIDNTNYPGQARITTSAAHGLVPQEIVSLTGVSNVTVGGSIVNIIIDAGIATVTTTAPHNLQVGAYVFVQATGYAALPFTVTSVSSATTFSYPQDDPNTTLSGGAVTLIWPGNQDTSESFTVQTVDSPTSFFVALDYTNGTWTGGTLTFAWNGSFYVNSVLSPTSFTYNQIGPDAVLTTGSGTASPLGQIAPGQRSAVVIFQTKTGYLTGPSLPVTISTDGTKYVFVSNVPIGPPNVIARIIAFTGAGGGNYFYLPVAPRDPSSLYLIGTSTVINDNVTTSAILDFNDEALLNGTAIDIPGNNLFQQVVLGPCLGFYTYASRLIAWGERNKVQAFLNMGFEGGYYATAPNAPLGWNVATPGTLVQGPYSGMYWQFGASGIVGAISQGAYRDRFGNLILTPQTQYTFRAKTNGTVTADLYSPAVGILATGTFTANGYGEAVLSAKTPLVIPPDAVLRISSALDATTLDEVELYYTQNPYLLSARVSYVNNPEAFDGVTGLLGPSTDVQPVMSFEERRDSLCMLTFGPNGNLYETEDTASGEPVTWDVRHVSSKCGIISVWGGARFEDWFVWASDTGLRIYDGGTVDKMSQEEQPWWDSFNPNAKQFTVLGNDPYTRRLYILACTETATACNSTKVMDYRDLNTAGTLSSSGPVHVSNYSGKVITTDLTRKWSGWSMTMNYCGVVSIAAGGAVMTFCGGTGGSLADPGYAAVYTLQEGVLSGIDEDYGPFWQNFSYPTYFFVGADEAQQRQLGSHRLQHKFLTMNVSGVGQVYIQPTLDRTNNFATQLRALSVDGDLARDLEWGLNLKAERISYVIRCQPDGVQPFSGTVPAGVTVSSLVVAMKTAPYSPIRGRNSSG
jgi:hypothetical protein